MIKEQADLRGDFHPILTTVRDAGRLEGVGMERQRVLVEIVLALDKGREISWVKDALLELKECIDNPRPQAELDALLLASIKKVAL